MKADLWTEAEDMILRQNVGMSGKRLMELLAPRTWQSIRGRKLLLKKYDQGRERSLTRKTWTVDEDVKLRQMIEAGTNYHVAATVLGRTSASVKGRIQALNLLGTKDLSLSLTPMVEKGKWPELGANAFENYNFKPEPRFVQNAPQNRTMAGTVGVLG